MSVLLIESHYPEPTTGMDAAPMAHHIDAGRVTAVREIELTEGHFANASGLITGIHLDQLGFLRFSDAVEALLDRGGRWIFNGHVLRPLIEGLRLYVPLPSQRRADLDQMRVGDHPVFSGIDQKKLEENRGVAGFYGRGHNPPPEGAMAINVIGPDSMPIDWVWHRPRGGAVLCHAGNDFWSCGDDPDIRARLLDRAVQWAAGELS